MNTIDFKVTEVLSEPIFKNPCWDGKIYEYYIVKVKVIDIGGEQEKELMFYTLEEANKVKVGYEVAH